MKCTTLREAIARYGQITNGVWANESSWLKAFRVPADIYLNYDGIFVSHFLCNLDMIAPLQSAFQNVLERGHTEELKTFDGCFNIRNVRGSSGLSCHAYGLAIDLNAALNPLGSEHSAWTADFVKCFTDEGFDWGGNFSHRKDPMHFSWAWEGRS